MGNPMEPNPTFLKLHKPFWANVRSISEYLGYTERKTSQIKVPTPHEVIEALSALGLESPWLFDDKDIPTVEGKLLIEYFTYRAKMLNSFVEPRLLTAKTAKALFDNLYAKYQPTVPLVMNKQKGAKKAPSYLTCIVNTLIEANAKSHSCNYDPRQLTTITKKKRALRTLARRVDGAFPSVINPHAVWEIKEYYYTTTFGSRVADGVYETLLDGMELEELREHEGIHVLHYLIIDDHFTWWECGRSYLCRIIDMLHMGYVDEVLFGREVVDRLPIIVKQWVKEIEAKKA